MVAEYAAALKSYGITKVQADKYAGQWVVEAFAKCKVSCEQSAEPKSVLYGNLLPLLNSGRVELLDHPRLQAQLLSLERRTARGGKDSIDHAPGAHDDLVNAAAGALVGSAGSRESGGLAWMRMVYERQERGATNPWAWWEDEKPRP